MESNGEMTKRELAEKLHVSASFITQLFNGDKVLNFELLAKIQNIFKFDFFVTAEKRIPVTDEVPISHLASPKWAKAFPFKDLHGQCYSHMFMDNYRKVTLSDMDIDTFDPERKTA